MVRHHILTVSYRAVLILQAVNTRGPFLGMKYAIAQMMKQEPRSTGDRGWVVNIASIGGLVGLSMERMLHFQAI